MVVDDCKHSQVVGINCNCSVRIGIFSEQVDKATYQALWDAALDLANAFFSITIKKDYQKYNMYGLAPGLC